MMTECGMGWRDIMSMAAGTVPRGNIGLVILVLLPFLMGAAVYGAGRAGSQKRAGRGISRAGRLLAVCAVTAELLLVLCLAGFYFRHFQGMEKMPEYSVPHICGLGLRFCMDGLRLICCVVSALMWFMTTLFAGEYFARRRHAERFYLFLLWTQGTVMGVFLSADLLTTFVFFELMSFTSYVWVAQEENVASLRAAETYLAVAVIGGMVLLMGIFLLYRELGTLEIAELARAAESLRDKRILYAAGTCMLVGFGAKAGAFPLHIWLPRAHPVAPAPASALLSGILTKTGIYGILILGSQLFHGDEKWGRLLLALGAVTMVLGAVLAVFSLDLKRTLACSTMSQIGFILVGVGMQGLAGEEKALAVHGTLLHMVSHSLIKLVLFMAAGVIYLNVHESDLNTLRGYGREKPLLKGIFLAGALSVSGVPLSAGYVSKTLLHESIVEYGGGGMFTILEWLFLISGGLTAAYMTKLFVAIFVEKNGDGARQASYEVKKGYWNPGTGFALTASAGILVLWGLAPGFTMDPVAWLGQGFMGLKESGEQVAFYSPGNLAGAVVSMGIGAAVYIVIVRGILMKTGTAPGESSALTGPVRRFFKWKQPGEYVNPWPAWLDLEELLYRPLLLSFLPLVWGILCRLLDSALDLTVILLRRTLYRDSPLPRERAEGNVMTAAAGHVLNGIQWLGNHTWKRRFPTRRDYVHLAAMKHARLKEDGFIIRRSLSFGLLLVCLGLGLTLLYILLG
ncbi:Na(+)/H(+) antiporter subunit D [Lachnospiraceae bacterium]|nr:Na(+)/H(+) antiporter subunit D [Lachnospiraceae bacterium]